MAVVPRIITQSYWDILPVEIQDLIIEERDKILLGSDRSCCDH